MYVCKHYVRVGGELRFPGEVLEEGEAPEEALRRLLERGAIETVDGGDPSGAAAKGGGSSPSPARETRGSDRARDAGGGEPSDAASPADEAEEDDAEAAEIDAMVGFVEAPGRRSASKGGRRK